MTGYLIKRLIFAAASVWLTTALVFVVLRLAPGDASLAGQGVALTPEKVIMHAEAVADEVAGELGAADGHNIA